MRFAGHTAAALIKHPNQLHDAANLVPYSSLAPHRQWLGSPARLQFYQHEQTTTSIDLGIAAQ